LPFFFLPSLMFAPTPQINAIDSQSPFGDGALAKWRFKPNRGSGQSGT
jgi:hypothetical protein